MKDRKRFIRHGDGRGPGEPALVLDERITHGAVAGTAGAGSDRDPHGITGRVPSAIVGRRDGKVAGPAAAADCLACGRERVPARVDVLLNGDDLSGDGQRAGPADIAGRNRVGHAAAAVVATGLGDRDPVVVTLRAPTAAAWSLHANRTGPAVSRPGRTGWRNGKGARVGAEMDRKCLLGDNQQPGHVGGTAGCRIRHDAVPGAAARPGNPDPINAADRLPRASLRGAYIDDAAPAFPGKIGPPGGDGEVTGTRGNPRDDDRRIVRVTEEFSIGRNGKRVR